MGKPYTPERAYRWSVLPLGIFMIFSGIVLPSAAMFLPSDAIVVPPFSDPWTKRVVFCGASLPLLPLGIGFCLRNKLAWWGFFAWALIGTVLAAVAQTHGPDFGSPENRIGVALGSAVNILLVVGICFATRPVFVFDRSAPKDLGNL
jgi:hypothetical protein